jgi:hypothetical protein
MNHNVALIEKGQEQDNYKSVCIFSQKRQIMSTPQGTKKAMESHRF